MKVLSLFDGIGTGRLVLDQLGIPVEAYYASEIDEKAVSISARHYPDIIQLGDVNRVDFSSLPQIDLLLGGSPCQDVSIAGKREGLGGARSGLYKKYVEALEVLKPTYFLLENTKMRKEYMETISADLGVAPIELDSSLFSATARKRLYWFNFTATKELPRVEKTVQDILEDEKDVDKKCVVIPKRPVIQLPTGKRKWGYIGNDAQANRIYNIGYKSVCLTSLSGGLGAKTGLYKVDKTIRMLTPLEAERVMGLPDKEICGTITLWSDKTKSYAGAETLKVIEEVRAGNAERMWQQDTVLFALQNLSLKNLQTEKHVHENVQLNASHKEIKQLNTQKLRLYVNNVELQNTYLHPKLIENFALVLVAINTIAEKITNSGKAGLLLNEMHLEVPQSGRSVVNLFGKEMMPLVNDAQIGLITPKELLKSITLDPLNIKNQESILITLYWSVILAIIGYTPKEILNENSLKIEYRLNTGYTEFGVSDTAVEGFSRNERYKMIGNGWSVETVKYILGHIK